VIGIIGCRDGNKLDGAQCIHLFCPPKLLLLFGHIDSALLALHRSLFFQCPCPSKFHFPLPFPLPHRPGLVIRSFGRNAWSIACIICIPSTLCEIDRSRASIKRESFYPIVSAFYCFFFFFSLPALFPVVPFIAILVRSPLDVSSFHCELKRDKAPELLV